MGQRFYFTNKWAVRVDLSLLSYFAPDPADTKDGGPLTAGGPVLDASAFNERLYFNAILGVSLVGLL